jgi:hypothetical protein
MMNVYADLLKISFQCKGIKTETERFGGEETFALKLNARW